jgi:CheY-like chemotaxis protein
VDVSRLAAEMLELLKVSISKHAVLRTNLGGNLPAVQGNAAQIRQVVMNLVINASEAIGEKEGVISVTTAQVGGTIDLASSGVTALGDDEYVQLEVSDTGCGMTEVVKAKVFDPFFSTKFAGRGLGLPVVQGIVRAHGGAIRLITALGMGTTVQVLLPCAPQNIAKVNGAVNSVRSVGSHTRAGRAGIVLVVEDEEVLRLAVSKALRKIGFSVIEASDGSTAVDLLRTHKDEIDIVLLDVTLPGTPSREVFEMTERMRPDLRVIVTSAYSKESIDASFAGHRVEHFLRKPFHLDELRACIQTLWVDPGLVR